MTDFNDPDSLADALDADADTYERVGSFAPNCTPKLRAAAVLLRRQGEALAALTDAIAAIDGAVDAAMTHWTLIDVADVGGTHTAAMRVDGAVLVGDLIAAVRHLRRQVEAAAAAVERVGSGAVERPTLDDTEERSDGA